MKRSLAFAIIVMAIIVTIIASLFYQNQTAKLTLESVTIGHVSVESFALLYVAQNQGYFTQNNLNITIVDYPTGTDAVKALTAGSVDIAGSSEYVIAYNAVERQNISIIGSLGEAQIVDLIAGNQINAKRSLIIRHYTCLLSTWPISRRSQQRYRGRCCSLATI